ncbi:dihydrofolate reductase family protein [Allosediminivita pacifica]|uniref:5-amino-6-(5-phosphoribosylamino)uracil reductase n=1 Tax=Allosediminivita pacifica TaxID=1267769 RepID=A0A2T6A6D5_9RHOB|nr:dihydrofolate reductase family protein [Allosediminivita pacifica]PTX39389.1 5-amino-6-(5-phosphoribosylamino)uracil reductase [Allosediminivita pacifica]GGB28010.1 riboflavin deaminase [Allosediminivita pacifica]
MSRPDIICHMITSLDGKLLPERWPTEMDDIERCYETAETRLEANGWIVGRATMAHYLTEGGPAVGPTRGPREDRLQEADGRDIALCFDREGRLRPETGDLGGDHLVLAMSEQVSDDHVNELAARGVSVVFAGPSGSDIAGVLEKVGAAFGVTRMLLEGGGRMNGAFLAAGLIDGTSTLVHPVIDGGANLPSIYEGPSNNRGMKLSLVSAESLQDGTVWLRHEVTND